MTPLRVMNLLVQSTNIYFMTISARHCARCYMCSNRPIDGISPQWDLHVAYSPITGQTLSQEYLQNQLLSGHCLLFLLAMCLYPHYPNQYLDIYRYVSILLVIIVLRPSEGGNPKYTFKTLQMDEYTLPNVFLRLEKHCEFYTFKFLLRVLLRGKEKVV